MKKAQTFIWTVWASMLTLLALIPFADSSFFLEQAKAMGGYVLGFTLGISVVLLWVIAICYWIEKF